jgi:hypothetical protein
MLAILERNPLGYRVARQSGLASSDAVPDYPPLTFAFHDKATIPAGLDPCPRRGLAEDEARKLL